MILEEYTKTVNRAFGIYEDKMIELSDCIDLVADAVYLTADSCDEAVENIDRYIDKCQKSY